MARATDRNSFQKEAEARFPQHRVDVPVPESGLGNRLTEMHDWCREKFVIAWAMHAHQERRKGERPVDYVRFYFESATDAEAFRRQWSVGP